MYTIDVEIAKSKIDGLGVFSLVDIPNSKIVWIFKKDHDKRITKNEFLKLSNTDKEHLNKTAYFSPWSKFWVYPPNNDPAEYTNHSESNNLSVMFDKSVSPEPYFVANRDIKRGEELTNNYKEFDEMTRLSKPEWAK